MDVLSQADVFLLPSATESFGLAALEAMACEVPVVASRVGGMPEVIDDGVTGFLHAPDDVDGMAASIVRLVGDRGAARAHRRRRATSRPRALLRRARRAACTRPRTLHSRAAEPRKPRKPVNP